MVDEQALKDQKKRVGKVVHFIQKNSKEEHSLEKLSSLAHYSPFHFQKVFKQVMGVSPKQYVSRLRLDNAGHAVVVHRHKSIADIASEYGFSSSSVFARAFKAHFGVSAEELRRQSANKEALHQRNKSLHRPSHGSPFDSHYDETHWRNALRVSMVRQPLRQVVFVPAPLSDAKQIRDAFCRVVQFGERYDLISAKPEFVGIINPHQGQYLASLLVNDGRQLPDYITTVALDAGKYATYKLKGGPVTTFHSLHAFYDLWLSESGYRILNLFGFEELFQDPTSTAYEEIERQIFISVEPA